MHRFLAWYTNSYLSYMLMFFFYDIGFALFSALISVYLMDKGLSAAQVSLVVSAAALAAMATQPAIGSLTDRLGMKPVNLALFALACGAAVLFMWAPGFAVVLGSYSLINLLMNGAGPVVERMATSSPYSYGSVRMWGTIGYSVGTQLAGILYERVAPEALYVAFIAAMLVCMFGFWGTQPRLAEAEEAAVESGGEKASPMSLLRNGTFLYYLLIATIYCVATTAMHSFCSSYLVSRGLDVSVAATVLSLAVLCELPLILLSGRFMDRVPNKTLLLASFVLTGVQLTAYALGAPLPVVIALTFLAKHPSGMLNIMTNMKVVNTIVDPRLQITGLALAKTLQSLGQVISNNVGGNLLDAHGYAVMFAVLAVADAVGIVLTLLFRVPSGNDKKLFS